MRYDLEAILADMANLKKTWLRQLHACTTERQRDEMRDLLQMGFSDNDIAARFNVPARLVCLISLTISIPQGLGDGGGQPVDNRQKDSAKPAAVAGLGITRPQPPTIPQGLGSEKDPDSREKGG